MTFSIGQNFLNDLLESSDKITHNDKKAIELTYELQKRLNNFFKNNYMPVLLKSKKVSGMTDLQGNPEPLGGYINLLRCGDNAPGSCVNGCSDEYPFWGTTKENKQEQKKENYENINEAVEQPEIIEKFTVIDQKENFSKNTSTTWIILIILIVVLVITGGYLFFIKNKNRIL